MCDKVDRKLTAAASEILRPSGRKLTICRLPPTEPFLGVLLAAEKVGISQSLPRAERVKLFEFVLQHLRERPNLFGLVLKSGNTKTSPEVSAEMLASWVRDMDRALCPISFVAYEFSSRERACVVALTKRFCTMPWYDVVLAETLCINESLSVKCRKILAGTLM